MRGSTTGRGGRGMGPGDRGGHSAASTYAPGAGDAYGTEPPSYTSSGGFPAMPGAGPGYDANGGNPYMAPPMQGGAPYGYAPPSAGYPGYYGASPHGGYPVMMGHGGHHPYGYGYGGVDPAMMPYGGAEYDARAHGMGMHGGPTPSHGHVDRGMRHGMSDRAPRVMPRGGAGPAHYVPRGRYRGGAPRGGVAYGAGRGGYTHRGRGRSVLLCCHFLIDQCVHGSRCHFSHDDTGGACRYGAHCRYGHDRRPQGRDKAETTNNDVDGDEPQAQEERDQDAPSAEAGTVPAAVDA